MVRQAMLNSDPIQELLGDSGRVYSSHVQDSEVNNVQFPSIVFELLSGSSRWHGYVQSSTLEIFAYSKIGSSECVDLYDQIYESLQHTRLVEGGVLVDDASTAVIFEVQCPVQGFNREIGAWFMRGRWQLNGT